MTVRKRVLDEAKGERELRVRSRVLKEHSRLLTLAAVPLLASAARVVATLLAVDGPATSSSESLPYPARSAKGQAR